MDMVNDPWQIKNVYNEQVNECVLFRAADAALR